MKLEVGKKYVTRRGDIITITEYDGDYEFNGVKYPYRGSNGFTYTEDGDLMVLEEDHVGYLDIIKEHE